MKKELIILGASLLLLVGCKPTENNYRSAYEAAKNKREAANAEAMMPATGLLSDDGVMRKVVDGDTVYVSRDRLRRDSVSSRILNTYNVAVGVFKMNTNARAQAAALREAGYKDAIAVETTGDRWYTIAGCFPSLGDAQTFIKDFMAKNKDYPFIGLPASPVIVSK
ncbi:MAG: SPOR domain-containing protein [Muribaculaceae bacterium]|nr:SPOR domain-containing protein [Muribaculaceae bacterium]